MKQLTSILAVGDRPEAAAAILEKAVALARPFGGRVELLLGDPIHVCALATLCSKLRYREVTLTNADLAALPLHEIILRHAHATHPDLVIKAPAGARPSQGWTLDANDWRLADESAVPVLFARRKPWANPWRFAAAVDVAGEDKARIAHGVLEAAAFLTLGCHADLDILYCEREQHDAAARRQRSAKLAHLVRDSHAGCERIQVFSGVPEKVLPPLAAERRYDVLLLGAPARQRDFTSYGSMTHRLAEATGGDLLLVRTNAGSNAASAPSAREQRPHHPEQLF